MSRNLIAIMTCQKYLTRLKSIQDTWIPQVIEAGFDVEVFTGSRLGVSDDYYALPEKVKAICHWAWRHNYDHMLKTDDDTYIRVNRFKVPNVDYAGFRVPPNDCGINWPPPGKPAKPGGTYPYEYASGGAYWLSKRSLGIIVSEPLTEDWAEDRWVGNTLGRHGIKLTQLPGYFGGNGPIEYYLTSDAVVLTQVAGRTGEVGPDILKCHESKFDHPIPPPGQRYK